MYLCDIYCPAVYMEGLAGNDLQVSGLFSLSSHGQNLRFILGAYLLSAQPAQTHFFPQFPRLCDPLPSWETHVQRPRCGQLRGPYGVSWTDCETWAVLGELPQGFQEPGAQAVWAAEHPHLLTCVCARTCAQTCVCARERKKLSYLVLQKRQILIFMFGSESAFFTSRWTLIWDSPNLTSKLTI